MVNQMDKKLWIIKELDKDDGRGPPLNNIVTHSGPVKQLRLFCNPVCRTGRASR